MAAQQRVGAPRPIPYAFTPTLTLTTNPSPSPSPNPSPNPNQVPLYGAVVSRMQRGSGHNYDDINEAFWAPRCLVWLGLGLGKG